MRDGDQVRVFNGRGLVATGVVSRHGKDVSLRVIDRKHAEPPVPLVLAIGGLDTRDRLEFAVEKAVELGATSIIPVMSERVQRLRSSADRLEHKAVAALTQSGNPWMPVISEPRSLVDVLNGLPADHRILLGDPEGGQLEGSIARGPVCCLVGPEGGFSPDELSVIQADDRCTPIAIGRLRLRAETAGVALMSVVRALRA